VVNTLGQNPIDNYQRWGRSRQQPLGSCFFFRLPIPSSCIKKPDVR
jgi:hypothetical protein